MSMVMLPEVAVGMRGSCHPTGSGHRQVGDKDRIVVGSLPHQKDPVARWETVRSARRASCWFHPANAHNSSRISSFASSAPSDIRHGKASTRSGEWFPDLS